MVTNEKIQLNFKKSYSVNFDSNGGEGLMNSLSIPERDIAKLPINSFIKASYTFNGWSIIKDGNAVYVDQDFYTMGTSDATLYAVWTQNPLHTVTFIVIGLVGGDNEFTVNARRSNTKIAD